MKITLEDVEKVAKLARLELSQAEREAFAKQLSQILTHVETLKQYDTTGIEPTATVLGQVTAARRLGYGMREIGLVQGTKSISTWIKTPDGRPAAAVTVSAVRTRLGPRREQEVAEILLREARIIEQVIRG